MFSLITHSIKKKKKMQREYHHFLRRKHACSKPNRTKNRTLGYTATQIHWLLATLLLGNYILTLLSISVSTPVFALKQYWFINWANWGRLLPVTHGNLNWQDEKHLSCWELFYREGSLQEPQLIVPLRPLGELIWLQIWSSAFSLNC